MFCMYFKEAEHLNLFEIPRFIVKTLSDLITAVKFFVCVEWDSKSSVYIHYESLYGGLSAE